jgi:hypothetical protein
MIRDKWIEEKFPFYFIHHYLPNGKVILSASSDIDLYIELPLKDAEQLIATRDKILEKLKQLANALNDISEEDFNNVWYNTD